MYILGFFCSFQKNFNRYFGNNFLVYMLFKMHYEQQSMPIL